MVPRDNEDDEIHDDAVDFDPDAKILEDKKRLWIIYGTASICLPIIVSITVAVTIALKQLVVMVSTESPTLPPTNNDVTTQL